MEQFYNLLSGVSHQSLQMAVNGLWVGLILTGLAVLVLRFARATNAATRYLIWWSLLMVVVALPFLMGGAVDRQVAANPERVTTAATARSIQPSSVQKSVPNSDVNRQQTQPREAVSRIERSERPVAPISVAKNETESALSILTGISPLLIFGIWISVVSLLGLRLVRSMRQMSAIKSRSRPLDLSHLPRLGEILEQSARKRPIRVCSSTEVEYPMAAGLGKPAILIPADLVERMSDDELEAVILHELAHLLRWDDWTKLGQKVVEAFMCFHPAVHWIGRQLDLERELACDDQVVVQTGKPGDYARCLTRLVQLTTGSATSLVPGALTSRKQIVKRFERLLLKKSHAGFRFSARRFVGALVPIALAVVLVMQLAPVVALPFDRVSYTDLSQKLEKFYAEPEPVLTRYSVAVPSPLRDEVEIGDEVWDRVTTAGLADLPIVVYEPGGLPTPAYESDLGGFYIEVDEDLLDDFEPMAYDSDVPSTPYVPAAPPAPSTPSVSSPPSPPRARTVGGTAYILADGGIDGTTITQHDNRTVTVTWSDGSDKLSVSTEGEVEFTEDDRDIKSISPGGFLSIEERRGRVRRELEVEAGPDGKLEYGYYERGRAREFDDDARDWMSDVLLEAIRRTGLGAEKRAARILKEDGVDGILAEVSDIESDYVKSIYLGELLTQGDLNKRDHARIVKIIGRELDSDYEKAELLTRAAKRIDEDPEMLPLLVEAAETIDSDYEVRRVLSALILDTELNEEIVETVLRIASRLDSDYEKAELLIDMSRYVEADQRFRRPYILAVKGLDSDYESRRVLSAINLDRELDLESIESILEIAGEIDSDYEKAELLIDLSRQCRGNDDLQRYLLRAASTLDSDYEMRRVLSSLPFDCRTAPDLAGDVLLIAGDLDSDYEKSELLVELAECISVNPALTDSYLDASRDLDSDYETKKVLLNLIRKTDLTDSLIVGVLEVAEDLDSDYEKSEILKDLVDHCRGKDKLEGRFIDVIESMDSDYEIDKLYSLLYRRGRGSN